MIIDRAFQNSFHYGLVTLRTGNIADVANCFPQIKSALYKNVLNLKDVSHRQKCKTSTKEFKSWTKKKNANHWPKKGKSSSKKNTRYTSKKCKLSTIKVHKMSST